MEEGLAPLLRVFALSITPQARRGHQQGQAGQQPLGLLRARQVQALPPVFCQHAQIRQLAGGSDQLMEGLVLVQQLAQADSGRRPLALVGGIEGRNLFAR